MQTQRGFGSDNHSGVHPDIWADLAQANQGHAPSYGTDDITQTAIQTVQNHFGPCEVFFVFNGTAANVLALAALVRPHESILCASTSHLHNDECGAPERFLGSKLIPIPSSDGKLTPALCEPYVIRKGDQHFSQVRALSLTQPTEYGTLYSLEELASLKEFALKHRLRVHIDGARLVNAAAALNVSLQGIAQAAGVDALSLGGTKNGLMFGEAVVLFKKEDSKEFAFIRKQAMQLPSKTRFIAVQFQTFLGSDLWLRTAQHANHLAKQLSDGLKQRGISVTQKTQANAVFALFKKEWIKPLRDRYFFYVWDERTFEVRLMTTFDTQKADIDGLLQAIDVLQNSQERSK